MIPLLQPGVSEVHLLHETPTLAGDLQAGRLSLRQVLERIQQNTPAACHLLLFVDQFEELYTLSGDASLQRRFVDCLLQGGPEVFHLLLTLRADFLAQALDHRPFADALQHADLKLGPMSPAELEQAIAKPAQGCGVHFEAGLLQRIRQDIEGRPGDLPLLEFALEQLWQVQRAGWLTNAGYEAIGGVQGALARYAEQVYGELSEAERAQAHRVFVQLVQPGMGVEDTRRLASKADLGESAWELAQKLAARRLVVTSALEERQAAAEVAHEALIRHWDRLRGWMNEDRLFRHWQEGLRLDLGRWLEAGRNQGALLHGLALDNAVAWRGQRAADLSEAEQDFIQCSRQRRAEEQAENEAQIRRLARTQRQRTLILAAGLLIASILTVIAFLLYRSSEQSLARANLVNTQAAQNLSRANNANARSADNAETAQAAGTLAVEQQKAAQTEVVNAAVQQRSAQTEAANAAVQRQIAQTQAARAETAARLARARQILAQGQVVFEEQPLLGLRLALEGLKRAPEENSAAQEELAGAVRALAGQGRLSKLGDNIEDIFASPDRSLIILDRAGQPGELRRAADGSVITLAGEVDGVSFSPDLAYFVVGYADASAELRRTADGSAVKLTGEVDSEGVFFSPDSAYFMVDYADAPGELRYVAKDSVVTLADEVDMVFFSLDSAYFVVDYLDAPSELRRAADGSVDMLADEVYRVFFSPDSAYFVVRYEDAPDELRRAADGSAVKLTGEVADDGVFFSPDSVYFVVAYKDAPDELRRAADGSVVTLTDNVESVRFSPDSAYFVVAYKDAPNELRRTADGSAATLTSKVIGMSFIFSPDWAYFVVGYADASGELRRAADGWVVTLADKVNSVHFSPDSAYFVVDYADPPYDPIYDVPYHTPTELRRAADGSVVTLAGDMGWVSFSPDSAYFVVDYEDAPGELRRAADGSAVTLKDNMESVRFSPDSAYFVVDYEDAPGELRHTADASVVKLAGEVKKVEFSPDSVSFVVDYQDASRELRSAVDGAAVIVVGKSSQVSFIPASAYFTIRYEDTIFELGQTRPDLLRLLDLGIGLESDDIIYQSQSNRLFLHYPDGRAYLLDLAWRSSLGDLQKLSLEELERLTCQGPFASPFFNESALYPYLEGEPSLVCSSSADSIP